MRIRSLSLALALEIAVVQACPATTVWKEPGLTPAELNYVAGRTFSTLPSGKRIRPEFIHFTSNYAWQFSRLNLNFGFGMGKMIIRAAEFTPPIHIDFTGPRFETGLRYGVYRGKVDVDLGAQFVFFPLLDGMEFEYETAGSAYMMDTFDYKEWQVGPVLSKRFGMFVPYAGVKYSEARIGLTAYTKDVWDDSYAGAIADYPAVIERDSGIGAFLGLNIRFSERGSVGFEGRFVDETACSSRLSVRFGK